VEKFTIEPHRLRKVVLGPEETVSFLAMRYRIGDSDNNIMTVADGWRGAMAWPATVKLLD